MDEVNISQLWLNDAISPDTDPVWRLNEMNSLSDAGGVHVVIHSVLDEHSVVP